MNPTTVSILGCGRLGFPLAKAILAGGCSVKGSTTSDQKISLFKEANIEPYCFSTENLIAGPIFLDFFDTDVLIITLPFLRSFSDPSVYLQQIETLVDPIQKSPIQKVIFTSSTSIYPDNERMATESMLLPLETERQKILFAVEQTLLQAHTDVSVLRMGGIWHGQDSAALMLENGKKIIANTEARMNVVHVDDCIGLIKRLVQDGGQAGIFNVCADKHPYRCEFYMTMAKKLGYAVPQFDGQQKTRKIIDNSKSKNELRYFYKYPDPLLF